MLLTWKKIGSPEHIPKTLDILNAMTTYLNIAKASESHNVLVLLKKFYPKKQLEKIHSKVYRFTVEPTSNISQI
jgi:hypothetical protein